MTFIASNRGSAAEIQGQRPIEVPEERKKVGRPPRRTKREREREEREKEREREREMTKCIDSATPRLEGAVRDL